MVRSIILCMACLFYAFPSQAGELENGIYVQKHDGEGRSVKNSEGREIILGERLGGVTGKATLRSIKNDNSRS